MRWPRRCSIFVVVFAWCLAATVIAAVVFAVKFTNRICDCDNDGPTYNGEEASFVLPREGVDTDLDRRRHKLCLVVPYRNRFEELLRFVPHMSKFLSKKNIRHSIFVVNQADTLRFNRASLINVGFLHVRSAEGDRDCDYVGVHDVDLLPINEELSYEFPSKGPFHVAAPGLHPRYEYPSFLGAILLMKVTDFELVKGMSNQYWGWGMEDDEFYHRLKDARLEVQRPEGIKTGTKDTFLHIHGPRKHARDFQMCYNQRDKTRRRDRLGGFHTVDYEMASVQHMTVDGHHFQLLNVQLKCDKDETPWCDCRDAPQSEARVKPIRKEDDIRPHLGKNRGIVQKKN